MWTSNLVATTTSSPQTTKHEDPMETQPARMAYIHDIRSYHVEGTQSADEVLEAMRTSTHLRTMTEQVQGVLARHGRKTVDPSDPDKRSYYDTARGRMLVLLPSVDCPKDTARADMSYAYHNERYSFDIDIDMDPNKLIVIRDALAAWPHTTLVARSVSHEALWAAVHGPKAASREEFKHYQTELIAKMPDVVRPHVATGQNDLARPRYWPWDPESFRGEDVQADLTPPPPLDEKGDEDDRQTTHGDPFEERERARSALRYIPLGADTYNDSWLPVGMALVNADAQFGPEFDGSRLFVEWTNAESHPDSTKPGRASKEYRDWTKREAGRPEGSPRRTLSTLYALAREHGWTPPPSGDSAAPGAQADEGSSLRSTVIVGKDLHRETQAVIENVLALNQPPTLFANADSSAAVEFAAGEARPLSRDHISTIMSAASRFVRLNAKGKETLCYPPPQLVGAVYAAIPRHLPPLYGIKRAPFLVGSRLVSVPEPGYHVESGYWIDQGTGWDLQLDIGEALTRLEDLLGEFPYAWPADRASAYGMLIGQALKAEWISPILEVSKPASQTGASKLCQTLAYLADGVEPATMTAATREEETDKRIITELKGWPQSLLIDNVPGQFSSDIVASGMTAKHIGGRVLGRNETARMLTAALQIYITGNNAVLSRDMINRSVSVRLDAKVEHPEERTGFRHQLPEDALANRVYYFSAPLSLVQRWIDAGRPGPPPGFKALDSFRPWMNAVAAILHLAGIPGFHENRKAFRERADESGAAEMTFVSLWAQSENTVGCRPGDILELGEEVFDLKGNTEAARAVSFGIKLSKMEDKVFELDGKSYTMLKDHTRRGSEYSLVSRKEDGDGEGSVTT